MMMPQINGLAVAAIIEQVAIDVEEQKDYLCDLDGEVGDGDHGVSMTIGMRAVRRALKDLSEDPTPEQVFMAAAEAYAIDVGATIGPLYEAAFEGAAIACAGKSTINDPSDWVDIFSGMFTAIQELGGAQLGDKTLLDAFHPAIEVMRERSASGADLIATLATGATTARQAAEDTRNLKPMMGRASRLGDRAIGHQDAGATSLAIILEAIAASTQRALT
jgi:dihydroxyacetone kinase-like protein